MGESQRARARDDHRRGVCGTRPQQTERHFSKAISRGYGRARRRGQKRPGRRLHHEGSPPERRNVAAQCAERKFHRPPAPDARQRADVCARCGTGDQETLRRRSALYSLYRSGLHPFQRGGTPHPGIYPSARPRTCDHPAPEPRYLRRGRIDREDTGYLRRSARQDRKSADQDRTGGRGRYLRLHAGDRPGHPHDGKQ